MKINVGKLYTTQISLSEWFEKTGLGNTEKFRKADNEKREYLEVLRQELGVQYDKGIKLDLNERCALRLIPLSSKYPKLRIRGKTVAESMQWFVDQKIDPTKYRAEWIPHVDNAIWSTIFVASKQGIVGEIIRGNHHQLTQGFHVEGKPIRFQYNFKNWRLTRSHDGVLKHLKDIMKFLHVPSLAKQKVIKKRLPQAKFFKNYLLGYFETLTSPKYGIWFSDYNTILGDIAIPDVVENKSKNGRISGTPTSAGIVRGPVGKEILVRKMTVPTDIDVMMRSKGIITELGGILSHAAIICRELKKPCITAVPNATKKLKDGMLVEMNGGTGEITIL